MDAHPAGNPDQEASGSPVEENPPLASGEYAHRLGRVGADTRKAEKLSRFGDGSTEISN